MVGIVTAKRMKEIENKANDLGVSFLQLMENAGSAAAASICRKIDVQGRNCVIVVGKGNNGGDALVVARKLFESGANVSILLADDLPGTEESKKMMDRVLRIGIEVLSSEANEEQAARRMEQAELVVDGVFGTGFHGELPSGMRPLFQRINKSVCAVFSLDIPSGVSADQGQVAEDAIQADFTIAFHAGKPGMYYPPAKAYCGEVEIVPIGVPKQLQDQGLDDGFLLEEEDVFSVLLPRLSNTHKGNYGRLLNICGSVGYTGAAILSAMGAERVGTGLLTVAAPASVLMPLNVRLPEAITLPLALDPQGAIHERNFGRLLEELQKMSCCLFGCGIGQGEAQKALLKQVIAHAHCPIILDADGINVLGSCIEILQQAKAPVILTPHMGEMARLLGISVEELAKDRHEKLKCFTQEHNVIVVLKDSVTAIYEPSGTFFINQTGNAGLAKGGSGDILAGMLAGICAQGIAPLKSAACAVYLHGAAADLCAKRLSQYAMTPSDLLTDLAQLFVAHGL